MAALDPGSLTSWGKEVIQYVRSDGRIRLRQTDDDAANLPASAAVYRALAAPLVGHVDPWFTEFMSGVQELLRRRFPDANHTTFPISASGSGESNSRNHVLEPGDEAIVCVNGVFSTAWRRLPNASGATIHRVSAPFAGPSIGGRAPDWAGP